MTFAWTQPRAGSQESLVHTLLSLQLGAPEWPQVVPWQTSAPLQALASSLQAVPCVQQGCPLAPQARQVLLTHALPAEHVELAQHRSPAAPQATQFPFMQRPDAQLFPQQGWPIAPQLPQVPFEPQARPFWQAICGDTQQGCPVAPQTQAPPAHNPWPLLHIPT